ncbi:MAG: class I SAM-dependent methyltransferase [Smithellaceae bacterium]|jgi:ubiquinone/menaquinone biosynthesis C-methylase UbiE
MNKISDLFFFRFKHVCPRWLCFTFDNVFRKLLQDPYEILRPYVKEGDTVLDVGPGIGYFTIPLAELVDDSGRVIAADIQQEMLNAIRKRAQRANVLQRIELQLASSDSLGVKTKLDFILAFWMVHEVPDKVRFFAELHSLLKDDGRFLMAEPKIHVTKAKFAQTVHLALKTGFTLGYSPHISLSKSALFIKTAR